MKKFYDQYIQVYIPKMWQNVFLKMKGSGLDPRHYPGHVANPFQGNVPFNIHWNYQKTPCCLIFSGDIEGEH